MAAIAALLPLAGCFIEAEFEPEGQREKLSGDVVGLWECRVTDDPGAEPDRFMATIGWSEGSYLLEVNPSPGEAIPPSEEDLLLFRAVPRILGGREIWSGWPLPRANEVHEIHFAEVRTQGRERFTLGLLVDNTDGTPPRPTTPRALAQYLGSRAAWADPADEITCFRLRAEGAR